MKSAYFLEYLSSKVSHLVWLIFIIQLVSSLLTEEFDLNFPFDPVWISAIDRKLSWFTLKASRISEPSTHPRLLNLSAWRLMLQKMRLRNHRAMLFLKIS
jgi:hypothetical protein